MPLSWSVISRPHIHCTVICASWSKHRAWHLSPLCSGGFASSLSTVPAYYNVCATVTVVAVLRRGCYRATTAPPSSVYFCFRQPLGLLQFFLSCFYENEIDFDCNIFRNAIVMTVGIMTIDGMD
uniref:Secreted protein n=1 Tax=Steinernema glaseri TaxID=37863 RepID=A0A1I7Z8Z8_9BILA